MKMRNGLQVNLNVAKLSFVSLVVMLSFTACAAQKPDDSRPRRVGEAQPAGNVIAVKAGDNLQRAIDRAKFGDTITLEAGATFTGPLTLPFKGAGTNTDADYVTIRSSDLSKLPADGHRVQPAKHAAAMPKILAPRGGSAIGTAAQAHHYKFIGIEFAPAPDADYVYNVIWLGSDDYKTLSQFPHHLVFDRCYVRSSGLGKARRGFALNDGETWIINSHISGFAGPGDETQAISGWAGPGPFHIINNYVEGAGQNIFFGGADPTVKDVVPSDIEVRGNYIYKPAEWFGKVTVKATFEMKNVRRLTVDGNLIESGGRASAFSLVVGNQGGTAPWSTIEDVEIVNNIIRHAGTGFNILGRDTTKPSQQGKRIRIANNLVLDLGTDYSGFFLQSTAADSVTAEHNTIEHTGNVIVLYGEPTTNLVFRNNIVQNNQYGVVCEGTAKACFKPAAFRGNIIVDNKGAAAGGSPLDRNYPPGNYFPLSFDAVKFVDYANNQWKLAADSRFKGKATDGKDPGVDFQNFPISEESVRSGEPVNQRAQ
jgi:Right handed beta helix region